ncbi:glycosyltransferase family 2 protein [Rhodococcus sovatensis]|uniref:Glycosyltransferase family 2 protein n=1 Tax=Rhodococcus sovatensis TaxID=1805840 RepID=A0ABZ2PJT5_9NOCA
MTENHVGYPVVENESSTKRCISVVMVTYNSRDLLSESLKPLVDASEFQIIVVDNASHDGTADHIKKTYPSVLLIQSVVNLGFAKAVNIGAKAALGDTIVLLNPDAIVGIDSIMSLDSTLKESTQIGVVAPLLEHPELNLSVREAGMQPSLWRIFCHYSGLSRVLPQHSLFRGLYVLRRDHFSSTDVEWVSGACMAVPRAVWTRENGLTERWFMYAEDVEFCMRVRRSGLRVVLSSESSGVHGLGKSSSVADKAPGTEWMVNLYELYKSDIASSRIQNIGWKYVFAVGMLTRAIAHGVRAVVRRENFNSDPNYKRFMFYSREILRVSSAVGK